MLTPLFLKQLRQQNARNLDVESALLRLLSAILHPLAKKANCPKVLGLVRAGDNRNPFSGKLIHGMLPIRQKR